jgi:hypothetical protein
LLLLAAIALAGQRTYELWQAGPWDLPTPVKAKVTDGDEAAKKEPARTQLVSTKNIIEKNLFDPERGAGRAQEAEASSVAMQRMRSMILLGTAILGSSRYAILQQPLDARPAAPGALAGQQSQLRLKLGDMVEGFRLSEIHEKRVVFTKGASRVEVALDFFRKVEQPKQPAPAPTGPRPGVPPRLPRPQAGEMPAPPVAR